jgi:hypothetical protein
VSKSAQDQEDWRLTAGGVRAWHSGWARDDSFGGAALIDETNEAGDDSSAGDRRTAEKLKRAANEAGAQVVSGAHKVREKVDDAVESAKDAVRDGFDKVIDSLDSLASDRDRDGH